MTLLRQTRFSASPLFRHAFLAAAASLALLVGLLAHFALSGMAQTRLLQLGLVALTVVALSASVLRAKQRGPEALGWVLLSCALLINALMQVMRIPGFYGIPAPGYLTRLTILLQVLGSCLFIGTLLSWNLAPPTRFARIRHGLDGLLFALAAFFILWGLVLGPAFLSDRFPLLDRFVWLGTFLVYDLLLGLVVFFCLPEPSRLRGPLGWLAAAFLLAGLHNFKWLMDVLSGNPVFHFPVGALIYAIPLTYLGAALSPQPVRSQSGADAPVRIVHLLPYVPVLGAAVLAGWLLSTGAMPGHRIILVWLALSLILVLLLRQYLALRDFAALSQHLESRVAERTQALEKVQSILLRTERINAMATMGAGLAHDMNNVLNAIQTRAELVVMDLDEGKLPNREDMVRVQEATQHAAKLSGRLMAMGRQDAEAPRAMDLTAELHSIQPLLQVLLPRSQKLRLISTGEPMPFRGTRGLLEQTLVNLVSNARDAMPEGGTITLRARGAQPHEAETGPLLEVEDTGQGIPEDMQSQVFQPFFTTKASGSGTGLGLVCVKSLLEQAGGSIRFTSMPGQGTIFQIRLPGLS
ncbi:sensor histidine kinase [Geothrix sp. PMB-07]|uniref:sensor histidine kinase n=1 Tax=Geothrix sp. PMB-07 TaxID=3068640 RepID=UPI002740FBCA|nr:HAMP domain-containing sensor histidine kinase [Geothrix sp. PMB-07]WLT33228.1 HAMP domain-containing sensor histidine kinase [Geothrix sp. PMB-07]